MRKLRNCLLALTLTVGLATASFAQWEAWAEPAREYVTQNGIMTDSEPLGQATRAQLANALNNLLGCETMADLSQFPDADAASWYYEDMAKAVEFGVFQGSDGQLQPEYALTRLESMVALSRVFGYWEYTTEAMGQFSDCYDLPVWAWSAITPMVADGMVKGNGDTLNPMDTLTRQEMAQLIYSFATQSGLTIYHPGDDLSSKVEGNLLVVGNGQPVELKNVTIKGNLLIGGNTQVTLTNVSAQTVKTFGPGVVLNTNRIQDVTVLSGDVTIDGKVDALTMAGDVTVADGTVKTAMVYGKTLTVAEGATVSDATLVQKSTVTGQGKVTQCTVQVADCVVETENTEMQEEFGPDMKAMTLTLAPIAEYGPDHMTTTATATLAKVPGDLTVDVAWYCNGKLVEFQRGVAVNEGATLSRDFSLTYEPTTPINSQIAVKVYCGTYVYSKSQAVNNHLEHSPYGKVETMEVLATVNYDASVYSTVYLGGYLTTVKKGDIVVYDDYSSPSTYHVVLPDGTKGFMSRSALTISTADFVQYEDYSTLQKEFFVQQKGYTSPTDLLVWISLKTQKVNVFSGGNGNWKLLHTYPCCSGKNMNPTEPGVHDFDYRAGTWDFGGYQVYKAMVFQGGHAFHTRTYITGTNRFLDATMGKNVSGGCIRMLDADVGWLWDNMKVGTTVVVY